MLLQKKTALTHILIIFLGMAFSISAKASESLIFDKATVSISGMHAKVAAGYVSIENIGAKEDVLLSVKSDFAKISEIHEMKHVNSVMKMRKITSGIAIKSNTTVSLRKGGYHIMFMKLAKHLSPGEVVSVKLKFQNLGWVIKDFRVSDGHQMSGNEHSHTEDNQ